MARLLALLLLALACAGCTGSRDDAAEPPGCGLVPESKVVGLVGTASRSTSTGSVDGLRTQHHKASCRTVSTKDSSRYVLVTATYHPAPVQPPADQCSEGWVYAGTPEKFTPACQQAEGGKGTTQLIVRWQPYVMRVTIGRPDRDWGGDPERALAMTRVLAQHLGVKEAAGDG